MALKRRIIIILFFSLCLLPGLYQILIRSSDEGPPPKRGSVNPSAISYKARVLFDAGGFIAVNKDIPPWKDPTSLEEIRKAFDKIGYRLITEMEHDLSRTRDE